MSLSYVRDFVGRIGVGRFLAIGLVMVSLALLPHPALAKNDCNSGKGKKTEKKKPPKLSKTAKFEIEFLKKSIDRHTRAIQRLQQADNLTTNVDVLALAHVFVARETEELTSMTAWLSSWYDITYAPKGRGCRWSPSADDDDPNVMIIALVMGYDHCEIAWAKQVLRWAGHAELKDMARLTKLTDRAEILQLYAIFVALDDDPGDTPDPTPTPSETPTPDQTPVPTETPTPEPTPGL